MFLRPSRSPTLQRRRPVSDSVADELRATAQARLVRKIGINLDQQTLDHALTHRSYAYENGGIPNNERLEFLGDSVLGLIVTETLFRAHPDDNEGTLAKMRSAVVNSRALADVARSLGLGDCLLLGRGEETTGGRDKSSILADTLEALLGAIYIHHGMSAAEHVVHQLFDPVIAVAAGRGAGLDWKTSLQERSAVLGLGAPEYELEESGPDHDKAFIATVILGGVAYGNGAGRTKKEAEQYAAEATYSALADQP